MIIGHELLLDQDVKIASIFGDLQLVTKQLGMIYRCLKLELAILYKYATILLNKFDDVTLTHVPRLLNYIVDRLAQALSSFRILKDSNYNWIKIERFLPPLQERLVK